MIPILHQQPSTRHMQESLEYFNTKFIPDFFLLKRKDYMWK